MDFTLTPISQLDRESLTRLASLHYTVMHTLLSDLGLPVVLRYYQAAQSDPAALGVCAVSPAGEITAWAIGAPDPAALNNRLRQPLPWFAWQMIRLLFTHPQAFIELIRSVLSSNQANHIKTGQIELTYIGVDPEIQGKGLGSTILTAFINAARSAGYTSIALSVETDNAPAVRLYTKYGFQIQQTFEEGRFTRHRMEYPIS